ncbi:MAG: FecR domain-containing protein [Reyranellaceae bacterium]
MRTIILATVAAAAIAAVATIPSARIAAQTAAQTAAPDVGVAATVINRVEGTVGQQTAAKKTGDKVFQNELIRTGTESKGQLLFRDETSLTIGPESEVKLDQFVYNPQGSSSVTLNATKGVFRFISGSLPSQAYEIKTPAATIGVRGTIINILLLLDGTEVFQNGEGSFVAQTLRGNFTVNRPGQVLVIRPGGEPQINGKLAPWQQALLAPILDPDKRSATVPDFFQEDRVRKLRNILRGRSGGYSGYDDYQPCYECEY